MSLCGATATYDGSFQVPADLVCGREPEHDGDHLDDTSDYPVEWPEGSQYWARRGPRKVA